MDQQYCPDCGSNQVTVLPSSVMNRGCGKCGLKWHQPYRATKADIAEGQRSYLERVIKGEINPDVLPGPPPIQTPQSPRPPMLDDKGRVIS